MEDFKIFEQLEKCKDYDIALMTTFNFDINFFERSILNILYNNNIKKVSVFSDSKELNKSITEVTHTSIGKKYMINPIEIKGAFHPKLILLLGQNKAKLFITSANLTVNGYYINNEIFNIFEYNANNLDGLKVINNAISFFLELNELSYKQDESLFDEIRRLVYFNKSIQNNEIYLLNNLNESILCQLKEIIKKPQRIEIAVPYYDNNLSALDSIYEEYEDVPVTLYLQNKKCKFNKERSKLKSYIKEIKVFEGFNDRESTSFYHGKVYRFITENESYIIYGSANCTESALIKTFRDNGNIECDILEKGKKEEFDYFFDNFKISEKNELTCDLIKYNLENKNNFYFKYGILDVELKLYFGYIEEKQKLKIIYNNKELKYVYQNNMLEISIPLREIYIDEVIKIQILFGNNIEELSCWFINKEMLELNRNKEPKDSLYNFRFDSENDKYIEDRIAILRAASLSYEDIQREIELSNMIEQTSKEVTEEDADDNGIVNYIIPSNGSIEQYRKKQFVKEIKNKYIERYFKEFKEKLYNKNINDESYQLKRVPRKPTTNEVKFRRFVKARISEMLNPKYIELVGAEHYLGSILVLNEIFDKYTLREKVEGLFENEYIIDVKTKLLHNLLNMNFENLKEEIIEDTKIICIQTIMENKYFNRVLENNYKIENKNRAILEELNKAFNIRENFEKYVIYAMDKINLYEEEVNYQMEIKYVNDLFGYKTEKQLKEQLIKEFGSSVKIEQKENSLIIKIATDNIGKYMKINENLINEVINHCEHYHKELDKIIIEIENIRNDYKLDADPAHYLIYNVDVLQRSYVQLIKRKSGQEDKKKYFTLK